MSELEKYIQTYFGVSHDEFGKISNFFHPLTLKKVTSTSEAEHILTG